MKSSGLICIYIVYRCRDIFLIFVLEKSSPHKISNMAGHTTPPSSYSKPLGFSQITVSHHPASSNTVTPVIIIRISRVEKNNAFTSVMEHDLVRAFEMLDQDDRVRAIVVTGEGKIFCAGADLEIGLHRTEGIGGKEHRDG